MHQLRINGDNLSEYLEINGGIQINTKKEFKKWIDENIPNSRIEVLIYYVGLNRRSEILISSDNINEIILAKLTWI